MSTKDHVWRNIHGETLQTSLTKEYADRHALVVNTGDQWVHGSPLALDSEGHPHFLLYLGDDTGHRHGGPIQREKNDAELLTDEQKKHPLKPCPSARPCPNLTTPRSKTSFPKPPEDSNRRRTTSSLKNESHGESGPN